MRQFILVAMVLGLAVRAHAASPAPPPAARLTASEIEAALAAHWPAKRLEPSPEADDLTFLRRAYLDLVGVIPSYQALASYRANTAPDRRARLTDLLVSTRRFADHWAEVLRHTIVGRQAKLDGGLLTAFEHWLAARLSTRGVGLDRIAREIVAAEGTPMDNPAVAPLLSFEDSKEDMAGHMARVFLGAQIQCAQCHDHPFEKWKQADFYATAAFFARARRAQVPTAAYEKLRSGEIQRASELAPYLNRKVGMDPKNPELKRIQMQIDRLRAQWTRSRLDPLAYQGATSLTEAAEAMGMGSMLEDMKKKGKGPKDLPLLFETLEGEIELPRDPKEATGSGKKRDPVVPRFLTGEATTYPDRGMPRRERLAAWMTAPANPWFARAMANRVWARLLGRGLTEPVDNIANPADATHRELLDRLAGHLVATGYDLKDLVRLIVSTRAYQRSVAPNASNARDQTHFSRGLVRMLEPEQIFASILEATGVEHTFKDGNGPQFLEMKKRFERQFVFSFANDEPGETVTFQGTVAQALFTLNGPAFNRPVKAEPGSAIDALRAQTGDNASRLRTLVLRVLSREPTPPELARLAAYLKARSEDPTWGTRPQGPPPPPQASWWRRMLGQGAPPKPASPKSDAARARVPAAKRAEAMWRAYEDVMWSLIACTEFLVNH